MAAAVPEYTYAERCWVVGRCATRSAAGWLAAALRGARLAGWPLRYAERGWVVGRSIYAERCWWLAAGHGPGYCADFSRSKGSRMDRKTVLHNCAALASSTSATLVPNGAI